MKNLLIVLSLGLLCSATPQILDAQVDIKEVSPATPKKFKKAPKKIYIDQFRVMYQLLFSQTETARGGRELGGGYRGEAKAGLTLAVQGLESDDIKGITDDLYQAFVRKYQDAGYEIVVADKAGKTKTYQNYERKKGGTLNEFQYPGYIMSIPTGFEYFVKRTNAKGKEKSAFNFYKQAAKLSVDLDNAIVVRVNIVVPFVEDAESGISKSLKSGLGGVAKIVVRPNLRIEQESVGAVGTSAAQTKVEYYYATNKIAPDASTAIHLKKDLEIPGVFEDKKYKAAQASQTDNWGTNYGAITVFHVTDQYMSKAHAASCDPSKYVDKVNTASMDFLNAAFGKFQEYAQPK